MNCPSPNCGSSNVQLLSHYLDGLPPGSPHRSAYAAPDGEAGSLLGPVVVALLGVLAVFSGAILAGLLMAVGGAGWGFVAHRRAEAAGLARSAWGNTRICLACSERWVP